MTTDCRDRLTEELHRSACAGREGIVYLVGLTTGTTTLAIGAVRPEAEATPTSVDVEARELGKIIRETAMAGLQVAGQVHSHPGDAYHSGGDFTGMRIRHPGYFSMVVPEYGARLPSFEGAHAVMWTVEGFREIDEPIRLFDGLGS